MDPWDAVGEFIVRVFSSPFEAESGTMVHRARWWILGLGLPGAAAVTGLLWGYG